MTSVPTLALRNSLATARQLLQRNFGYQDFRPLQTRVIEQVLAGRDVLAVLPTSGGKSICFQIPALIGDGLTLVVSPLIALMQDQVAALATRGITAAALNSTFDPAAQIRILSDAASGKLRLLYVSPERLPRAAEELLSLGGSVSRLAIDEAHCIVEWGHDFRPAYRQIRKTRIVLGAPSVIALTGSATPAVRKEIMDALAFRKPSAEIVGSFDRPNLHLEVVPVVSREDRLRKLVTLVRMSHGSAIVYAPTRGMVEALARILAESGVATAPYHAGMTAMSRSNVLEGFLDDRYRVVVATCAFGMGIDKSAVRLVTHRSMPSTPESYYQEAGRAGRDGEHARCVLFHHANDSVLPSRQIGTTFPSERILRQLWDEPALRLRHPASVIAAADRLAAELRPDQGPINWAGVRRRRREAERRLDAMVKYSRANGCRRRILLDWFGERLRICQGCDRCGRG